MRRIVVIGGLAAGPAAAARAAREDPTSEVTLVEAGPHVGYGVCELPHLVSGEIGASAALVAVSPERFERERRVRVLASHRAVGIDRVARKVTVRSPRGADVELAFDALVIATGSTPRRPAAGAARALKTIADAEAIRAAALGARGGHAAVLGCGYVGLLAADALAACGLAVTVFERAVLPLPDFEQESRRLALDRMQAIGIELAGGTEVRTGVVEGADLVVAALGADPETALAAAAGIEIGSTGAIRVDERGETSARGIFAAGDCAEVRHAVSGRPSRVALATVAQRGGRAAGANAAGGAVRMPAAVGALAFRFAGVEFGRVGLSSAEARSLGLDAGLVTVRGASRVAALPGGAPLLVTLVTERPTGRILGANVAGVAGAALRLQVLVPLVSRGGTAAELAGLELAYAPFLSPLRDPLLEAGAAAVTAQKTKTPRS